MKKGTAVAHIEAIDACIRGALLAQLDASSAIRESVAAGTLDTARRKLAESSGYLARAERLCREASEGVTRGWCDGCGDGKPGTMEHLTRGAIPCVVCNGGLALVDGVPADEGAS